MPQSGEPAAAVLWGHIAGRHHQWEDLPSDEVHFFVAKKFTVFCASSGSQNAFLGISILFLVSHVQNRRKRFTMTTPFTSSTLKSYSITAFEAHSLDSPQGLTTKATAVY